MGHSSLEAGDASEIRVVCIGHLARVRSWLTSSEDVAVAPEGATEAEDVAPLGARGAARAPGSDAIQP
jgi:hypothetical protein